MTTLQLHQTPARLRLARTIALTAALVLATQIICSGAGLNLNLVTDSGAASGWCIDNTPESDQDIVYDFSTGLTVRRQVGPSNGVSSFPDPAPGHLSYTMTGNSTWSGCGQGFSAGAEVVVQSGTGTVKMNAGFQGEGGQASGRVDQTDAITFTNTTGQPATVTIVYRFLGGMSLSTYTTPTGGDRYGYAGADMEFHLGISAFYATIARESSPPGYYIHDLSASNWSQGFEISPNSGGEGATYLGRFNVDPGDTTLSMQNVVDVIARRGPSTSDFSHTAAVEIQVPAGVSYRSESGGFLTAGSRMLNIASRAKVLGGDNVAIGGFIVTGNVPKKVIIRGIGPSLSAFGVPGPLADPVLELKQGNTTLATNDNWQDTQKTEIENSGLAPSNTSESAIVRTLNPGSYTAILSGKNNSTGIGVVEVYDQDAPADSRLANISTRAFVEAGDNVLIGGIIGGGNGSQPKVLIRAIGPSLSQFGVPNPLQDPILELHDKDGVTIMTNDNWETDQKDAIVATGTAPTNAKEAAIIATLLPTNYTAIVKGANNGTGVALVEVYHLQ